MMIENYMDKAELQTNYIEQVRFLVVNNGLVVIQQVERVCGLFWQLVLG